MNESVQGINSIFDGLGGAFSFLPQPFVSIITAAFAFLAAYVVIRFIIKIVGVFF